MVDRNQAAREREHAARMFQQDLAKFTRLLNEGKTGLVDRFGVQLTPGDLTLYSPDWPLVFDVGNITPVMDPSQPVGALNMVLTCTVNVKFMSGVRAMTLIKCGRRPEAGADPSLAAPGSEAPTAAASTLADDPHAEERALSDAAEEDARRQPSEEPEEP